MKVGSSLMVSRTILIVVVRTPLNAIINYMEIALEANLETSIRETITKAYKASRSLVYVIDDLLNLTKAEDSHVISPSETFDLGATGKISLCVAQNSSLIILVFDVISTFRSESIRRQLDLTVSMHPGVPQVVRIFEAKIAILHSQV
jgi:signal transduction histidine kinase